MNSSWSEAGIKGKSLIDKLTRLEIKIGSPEKDAKTTGQQRWIITSL